MYKRQKAITVTSPTTFSLNFDTSNLASAVSGSGGTVTRADVSITSDGMLQSNRVFDFLVLYSIYLAIVGKKYVSHPVLSQQFHLEKSTFEQVHDQKMALLKDVLDLVFV